MSEVLSKPYTSRNETHRTYMYSIKSTSPHFLKYWKVLDHQQQFTFSTIDSTACTSMWALFEMFWTRFLQYAYMGASLCERGLSKIYFEQTRMFWKHGRKIQVLQPPSSMVCVCVSPCVSPCGWVYICLGAWVRGCASMCLLSPCMCAYVCMRVGVSPCVGGCGCGVCSWGASGFQSSSTDCWTPSMPAVTARCQVRWFPKYTWFLCFHLELHVIWKHRTHSSAEQKQDFRYWSNLDHSHWIHREKVADIQCLLFKFGHPSELPRI